MTSRPITTADVPTPAHSDEFPSAMRSGGAWSAYDLAVPRPEDFARWSTATLHLSTVDGIENLTEAEARALAGECAAAGRCHLNSDGHAAGAKRPAIARSNIVAAHAMHALEDDVFRSLSGGRELMTRTDSEGPLLATAAMRQRPQGTYRS
jgi:hypothetical protein